MRIAFYAPLKSPRHATPSGDRRVARLLVQALERAGHDLELASEFRSLDLAGDPQSQAALRVSGLQVARELAGRWRGSDGRGRPDLWFTYHLYYKAPDWLGPLVSSELGIPYVVAEASIAPKRASGPWSTGHAAVEEALRQATLVLAMTRHDLNCLANYVPPGRVRFLPPFLDAAPLRAARKERTAHRASLGQRYALDMHQAWLVVAAMMRPGDKLLSYRELARALAPLSDMPWQLLVAGDGPARPEVAEALQGLGSDRVHFLGELDSAALAELLAAGDLFVWPAVNEAYGMAMLEAQAAGLPVVSCALRGVPDVVRDGRTALLAPPGDADAFAGCVRMLLRDAARRETMGCAAADWVARERDLAAGTARLDDALAQAAARAAST